MKIPGKEKLEPRIKEIEKKAYRLLKTILQEQNKERIRKRQRERAELIREILLKLTLGLTLPASLLLPNLPLAVRPILKNLSGEYKVRPYYLLKTIRRLKEEQFIAVKEVGGKQEVEITAKGKKKTLEYSIDFMKLPKKEKWDDKWRIIIFDVPNYLSKGRTALQEKLRELGCYQLQKSVYVYPYACKDEIDFVAAIFEVYPHIIFIEANFIEKDEVLRSFFNL